MKKTDNRGVSLVELLVAVCIMAIIAIPLLHSFVTSYQVNARSRQTMRATTLAQNEMEIFEKEKIADLSDPNKFAYVDTTREDGYHVTEGADGCYTFSRLGIINDKSGRQEFDVYVTLNPRRASSSDKYYTQNTTNVLSMNTISALDSGTYIQRIRTENNEVDLDTVAYNYFNTNKKPSASATVDQIKQNTKRTITIDITKETREIGVITTAKVTYDYVCSTSIVPEDKKTYQSEQVIYNNAQTMDEYGNPRELKSIYLFYAPRYGITDMDKQDTIVVNNTAGVASDIYLIRQELLKAGDTQVEPTPMNYQAHFKINDGVDGTTGKCAATYHTNLNVNSTPAEGLGSQVDIQLNNMGITRDNAIQAMGLHNLGDTSQKNRIYEMTVDVYVHGATVGTDHPVVTLTGTKLE